MVEGPIRHRTHVGVVFGLIVLLILSMFVASSASAKAPKPITNTTKPAISGTAKVGSSLKASDGKWSPSGVKTSRVWLANGLVISGATATTYHPAAADVGKTISVRVTAAKTGLASVDKSSSSTPAVAALPMKTTPVPTISGTTKIDSTLTAVAGSWSPAGVSFSYQWLRGTSSSNGVPISGATGRTYVALIADVDKNLSVRVTGTAPGYTTVAKTSSVTAPIAPPSSMTATPAPIVLGSAKVGSKLTTSPGTWNPAGVAFTIQWLRNGVVIAGETSTTHDVTPDDASARLSVVVTGSKPGYVTEARSSDQTGVVLPGSINSSSPSISGTPKVDHVLTVIPGAWGPDPVTLEYQWARDGTPIPGANSTTYPVGNADAGTSLTTVVTGTKNGYAQAQRTTAGFDVPEVVPAETTPPPPDPTPDPTKVQRALRTYYAALSTANISPVNIFVGPSDSIAEGFGATSVEKRWISVFRDAIRGRFQPQGVTGGFGYADPLNGGKFPDYPVSYVKGAGVFSLGLGLQALALFDSTQTITVDETFTDLDILYTGQQGGAAGKFSYTLDRGAPVIVNTGNKAESHGGYVQRISGLSPGRHVVVVTGVAMPAGSVIEGFMIYNGDKNSGIRLWEGAQNGAAATDFAPAASAWAESLGVVHPDLVILPIGSNDFGKGETAAATKARIEQIIAKIRAHVDGDPSIVLMAYYDRPNRSPDKWSDFVAMYNDIANADPDVCVFDLGPLFGPWVGDDRGGLTIPQDSVHPSDAGYSLIGTKLAEFVAP